MAIGNDMTEKRNSGTKGWNLKLSSKLAGGFAVVLLLTAAINYVGYDGLNRAKSDVARISDDNQLSDVSRNTKTLMLQQRSYEKDVFLNVGDPAKQKDKYIPALEAKSGEIREAVKTLADVVQADERFAPELREKAGKLPALYADYYTNMRAVASRAIEEADITPQAANKAMSPYKQTVHDLESYIDEISDAVTGVFEQNVVQAEASTERANSLMAILGAATLLLGSLLAFLITRSVVKPLKRVNVMLKDIAEGERDLTKRLEITSRDELGELAGWFNAFIEKVHDLISRISDNADQLACSSTELSATATYMVTGINDITDQSSTVAASSEEMTANMGNISASTEQMSANVKTVAAAVEEMTASISEIARNAEQAASVAEQASNLAQTSNDNIGQLGEAADAIGKVIQTIQDIAEQTNLLALNATIEAARAGDAGKGFAVVANEVKELAKQTAEATDDIRRRIEGIQNSTGSAVTSIGQISEVIGKVNEVSRSIASAVEEQSVTTKEIAQNVAQTASATEMVSQGVAESASASQAATKSIAEINAGARQTTTGAGHTQEASSELSSVAQDLQKLVGQFQIDRSRFSAAPIKAAHALWKKKLAELLAGKSSLNHAEIADHHQCAFGKWYFGEGMQRFGQMPIYKTIDAHHEKIHRAAQSIALAYNEGRSKDARRQFDDFHDITATMFKLLDEFEAQVDSTKAVNV